MKLMRCENGHTYDAEIYAECPYCREAGSFPEIPSRFMSLGRPVFLGKGSGGRVYRILGGRDFALKVVDCGKDPLKFQNAVREMQIMRRLRDCPPAVQLYDFAVEDGPGGKAACFLEDYHRSLPDYLSDSVLTASDAVRIAAGLCRALSACLDNGVLHLDVKPGNIFVDDPDSVLLGDFSSSLTTEEAAANDKARGTPVYMAPEVRLRGACSPASDVYSAGMVLFALFSRGLLPFEAGSSREAAMEKRLAGAPLPSVNYPDEAAGRALDRICRRACAFLPEDRSPSPEAMEEDLRELLDLLAARPEADAVLSDPSVSLKEQCDSASIATVDGFVSDELSDTIFPAAKAPGPPKIAWERPSAARTESSIYESEKIWEYEPESQHRKDSHSAARPGQTPTGAGTARYCPRCGSPLPPGARFCSYCGASAVVTGRPDAAKTASFRPQAQSHPSPPEEALYVRDDLLHAEPKQRRRLFSLPANPFRQKTRSTPSRVAAEPAAAPAPMLRQVQFSAVAPKKLIKGECSIINVVMYEESRRREVERLLREAEAPAQEARSGIHTVENNAVIRVTLSSPDVEIEDGEEEQVWQGGYLDFSFAVSLPQDYAKRQVLFTAAVYINGIIATRLKFTAQCRSFLQQKMSVLRDDVLSAFVSYASEDRGRVAVLVQGIQAARRDMDVFMDVQGLRTGDNWEEILYAEIQRRDVLYLCWSHSASQSKWVDREWRYALNQKGEEGIQLVALEPPDKCPPPEELRNMHFNDPLLFIIEAEKNRQAARTAGTSPGDAP